jgi:hypothetical protein
MDQTIVRIACDIAARMTTSGPLLMLIAEQFGPERGLDSGDPARARARAPTCRGGRRSAQTGGIVPTMR